MATGVEVGERTGRGATALWSPSICGLAALPFSGVIVSGFDPSVFAKIFQFKKNKHDTRRTCAAHA